MFPICDICGCWGHPGKACPLYRLNEQQTALGAARQAIAAIKERRRDDDTKADEIRRIWLQETPTKLM